MTSKGQVQYFRSPVDGQLYPCAVCATDEGAEPKPLLIELSPGAFDNLSGAVALSEEIAAIAARKGRSCIALRPTGRGVDRSIRITERSTFWKPSNTSRLIIRLTGIGSASVGPRWVELRCGI